MLKIPDFTKKEIDFIIQEANFTESELTLFLLRNKEYSLERCAEEMNVCTRTTERINKKVKAKIMKVIDCL